MQFNPMTSLPVDQMQKRGYRTPDFNPSAQELEELRKNKQQKVGHGQHMQGTNAPLSGLFGDMPMPLAFQLGEQLLGGGGGGASGLLGMFGDLGAGKMGKEMSRNGLLGGLLG